jgi:hypothetical protein
MRVPETREERSRRDRNDRILRCSDGHPFVSSGTARLFAVVRPGRGKVQALPPSNGRWRVAPSLNSGDPHRGRAPGGSRLPFVSPLGIALVVIGRAEPGARDDGDGRYPGGSGAATSPSLGAAPSKRHVAVSQK